MRSTRARLPMPILDLGSMRYGGFGGPFSVWLATTYVWLPEKVKCGKELPSSPVVNCLSSP